MPAKEFRRQWYGWRARVREKASRLTPSMMALYPFEVFVSVLALLTGVPVFLGASGAATIVALVGTVPLYAWAAALALGGATVLFGLAHPSHPLIVAAGLGLAAGCFALYAVTAVVLFGWGQWPSLVVYVFLAFLASVRSTHFRRVIDIQRGARRLFRERTR